ncbi:hypothetical protein CDAR_27541 [Caerostris darwini]|uniref:Uncharacterized protein n=1 Tax=Caerostris darwini TaxID=1538125 RepID=A0AAV4RY17_9ARAC|nr:hypothetical protein CDAR_27541 [Caerostris darwini]
MDVCQQIGLVCLACGHLDIGPILRNHHLSYNSPKPPEYGEISTPNQGSRDVEIQEFKNSWTFAVAVTLMKKIMPQGAASVVMEHPQDSSAAAGIDAECPLTEACTNQCQDPCASTRACGTVSDIQPPDSRTHW